MESNKKKFGIKTNPKYTYHNQKYTYHNKIWNPLPCASFFFYDVH